jgi:hypothetical protein
MNELIEHALTTGHHAVVYEGDPALAEEIARLIRVNAKQGTLDVVWEVHELLGVAESSVVCADSMRGQTAGSFRCIVTGFSRATFEAQNALLKAIEDPPRSTRLIFVVPAISQLLPTIRSRVYTIQLPKTVNHFDPAQFWDASVTARRAMLKPLDGRSESYTLYYVARMLLATIPAQTASATRTALGHIAHEALGRLIPYAMLVDYLVTLPRSSRAL